MAPCPSPELCPAVSGRRADRPAPRAAAPRRIPSPNIQNVRIERAPNIIDMSLYSLLVIGVCRFHRTGGVGASVGTSVSCRLCGFSCGGMVDVVMVVRRGFRAGVCGDIRCGAYGLLLRQAQRKVQQKGGVMPDPCCARVLGHHPTAGVRGEGDQASICTGCAVSPVPAREGGPEEMSMRRGFAFSAIGRLTVSTPLS